MCRLKYWGRRSFLVIVAAFVLVGQLQMPGSAQSTGGQNQVLTLDVEEAITFALEHNPDYLRAGIALRMAQLDFDYNASIFDPTFQAQLNARHTRTGGLSYESQVLSGTDSRVIDTQLDYSWLFPAGDAIKFSLSGNRSSYSSGFLGEDGRLKTYTSILGLSYSKPLLKGFGSAVTMAGIDKATVNVALNAALRDLAKSELIFAVRTAYLRTVAAREAVAVARVSLEEAESLQAETEAKVRAGILAPYQGIAAEAGLYTREAELIRSRGEYEKAINSLKELLGINPREDIQIAQGIDITLPEQETEAAVEMALENRPELIELKLRRKRAEVDLTIAANTLKPELGLTGGFGFQGEDFDFTGSYQEMDNFSWFAGLNYIVPLGGNRAAKAQMETAKLAMEEIDLRIRSLEEKVHREVSDALVELNNAKERVRVAKAGLEAARVKMDSERQRFELGLITAGDLLEYERDYSQAQLAEINARIEYLQAAALLARLTGAD